MNLPLISADQSWAIWAVLLAAAAFGLRLENTKVGRKLSGAILTMGFTFVLSNLGVIPAEGVVAYDVVWGYLVPLAIPLLLFRADMFMSPAEYSGISIMKLSSPVFWRMNSDMSTPVTPRHDIRKLSLPI